MILVNLLSSCHVKLRICQISKYRKAKGLSFDITVKSGRSPFHSHMSWLLESSVEQLAGKSTSLVMRTLCANLLRIDKGGAKSFLENNDEATLMCYCSAGANCHRCLLVPILESVSKHYGIELEQCGEII